MEAAFNFYMGVTGWVVPYTILGPKDRIFELLRECAPLCCVRAVRMCTVMVMAARGGGGEVNRFFFNLQTILCFLSMCRGEFGSFYFLCGLDTFLISRPFCGGSVNSPAVLPLHLRSPYQWRRHLTSTGE
jgi:hypothetical protein